LASVDGQPLDAVEQLRELLQSRQAGDQLSFEVIRRGEARQLTITLAERMIRGPAEVGGADANSSGPNAVSSVFQDEKATIAISTADGRHFSVQVGFAGADGKRCHQTCQGDRESVVTACQQLPPDIASLVKREVAKVVHPANSRIEASGVGAADSAAESPSLTSLSFANDRLTMAVSSSDGVVFTVQLTYCEDQAGTVQRTFVGSVPEIERELLSLPDDIAENVKLQLTRAGQRRPADGDWAFGPSVGLQPGNQAAVRVPRTWTIPFHEF